MAEDNVEFDPSVNNPYLNSGEEKGSYLSGDQGLVPDAVEGAVDVAADIGKGIGAGIISIPQGITELASIAVDGIFNTDTSRATTEAFNYIKPEVEGTAGAVTEELVAFGVGFIPVLGWLGRAGQAATYASKGAKVSRAGKTWFGKSAITFGESKLGQSMLKNTASKIGTYGVASMGYGVAISPDGRSTLSSEFESVPDFVKIEDDTGLVGRSEAGRKIRNKLRNGIEDGLMSGVVDTGLTLFGAGARAVGRTERGSKVAKAVLAAPGKVSTGMANGFEAIGMGAVNKGAAGARDKFREYFTPTGGADVNVYETVQDARAVSDMSEKRGVQASLDWDKALKRFFKKSKLRNKTPVDAQRYQEGLKQFLMGNRKILEEIGNKDMIAAADNMVNVRSGLEDDLIRQLETEIGIDPKTGDLLTPDTPAKMKAMEALAEIKKNQDLQIGYMRRQFEQYTNPVTFYKNLDLKSKDFDNAVLEVAANTNGDLAVAKETVLTSLGLKALAGESPESALERKLFDVTRAAKGSKNLGTQKQQPVLTAIDDIFVAREPLIDKSPSLQKIKGMLTDPQEVYLKTISDMAQANAAADMYRAMGSKELNLAVGPIEALKLLNKGGRPAMVDIPDRLRMTDVEYEAAMQPFKDEARDRGLKYDSESMLMPGEQVLREYQTALDQKGYTQLGDSRDIQNVFGGSYGALMGRMVSPETLGAISAPMKFAGNTVLGEAAGIFSQLRSLSQKMTIVPNPGAQVRNIAGNFMMLGANANLGRDTDFSDVFKIFTSSLADVDEAGLTRLAKKISLSGVEDTSLVVRALKEFRKAGQDLTSTQSKVSKAIDLFQDNIPFMQAFEKVYSDSDSFFKALALLGEEKKLLAAFDAAGLDATLSPDMYEAMLDQGIAKRLVSPATEMKKGEKLLSYEVMAADTVKDTMPIYPRIGKAVRALDVFPLIGNFTSFASENIRNSSNILERGLKEMAFTVPPDVRAKIGEEAASIFEKQIRGSGSQRLMSYLSVATIGPAQAVKASMYATGTTQEEYEAFQSQLPDFMKGHQTPILSNDKNGKIAYIDLSYVSPYAFVLDPVRAALQVYNEQGKLDKSQVERISSGAFQGLKMFASPFGEESLIYERVRDVLPDASVVGRAGKTKEGYDIYNSTDSLGTKMDKSLGHIMNGIIPSYGAMIMEFDRPLSGPVKAATGEGLGALRESLNQGRVMRAMTGTPNGRGVEYDPFKEAARLVTGFTPMELDLQNDLKYSALEYTPRRTETKSAAMSAMKQANLTESDMLREWDTYMDNLYREQSKLYKDVRAARTLGLSDDDIRKNLIQSGNMGRMEANAIMQGEFWPTTASKELWKDLVQLRQQEGRKFMTKMTDFTPFNSRARDRMREPLAADERTPFFDPAINNPYLNLSPAPAPAPAFDPAENNPYLNLGNQQGSISLPQAPTQTASAQVSPELLGGDPATEALARALGRA